jgi:hypothetical protein
MGAVTDSSLLFIGRKIMDLRQYFRKIQALEASLPDEDQVVVSLETSDGGKAGRLSEVSRSNAAKIIVEGRAMLATEEQKQQFVQKHASARKVIEATDAARRVQVAIISDADLSQLASRKNSHHK